MGPDKDDSVRSRIEKDIALFDENVKTVKSDDRSLARIIELSKMYAKDSKSYLDKGDFYTSFSCISYAHRLSTPLRRL